MFAGKPELRPLSWLWNYAEEADETSMATDPRPSGPRLSSSGTDPSVLLLLGRALPRRIDARVDQRELIQISL